jgi:hypothetical protein
LGSISLIKSSMVDLRGFTQSDSSEFRVLADFQGFSEQHLDHDSQFSESNPERVSEGFQGGSEVVPIVIGSNRTVSSKFFRAWESPRSLYVTPELRDVPDFLKNHSSIRPLKVYGSMNSEGDSDSVYLFKNSESEAETVPIYLFKDSESDTVKAETVTVYWDQGFVKYLCGGPPTFTAQYRPAESDQVRVPRASRSTFSHDGATEAGERDASSVWAVLSTPDLHRHVRPESLFRTLP